MFLKSYSVFWPFWYSFNSFMLYFYCRWNMTYLLLSLLRVKIREENILSSQAGFSPFCFLIKTIHDFVLVFKIRLKCLYFVCLTLLPFNKDRDSLNCLEHGLAHSRCSDIFVEWLTKWNYVHLFSKFDSNPLLYNPRTGHN